MGDFFTEAVTRTARKHHKCTYCGESLNKGDSYQFQKGIGDNGWFETKMHPECFSDFCASGWEEYTLYGNDRPTAEAQK